jgi:hypothetical protein
MAEVKSPHDNRPSWHKPRRRRCLAAAAILAIPAALCIHGLRAEPPQPDSAGSLDETRLALSKWIQTQQLITKERKEWQQGKEILLGRVDLVQKEISDLEDQIKKAQETVDDAQKNRSDLQKQSDDLKSVEAQLTEAVVDLEAQVRGLNKQLPGPVQERVQPLVNRMPQDSTKAAVSVAERYQNVLGILNEINKANGEINIVYEVHGGSQVPTIYIGLARAYYANGKDAGTSRITPNGWEWESSNNIATDVLKTLEIIQGRQTATFVPLPMKIQ